MRKTGKQGGNRTNARRGVCLGLCFLMLLFLPGCRIGAPDDAQVQAILAEKLPAAKELLSIIYGDAVPVENSSEIDESWNTPHYFHVASDFKYQTIDSLKAAAEEVFSADYLETVYEYAFGGTEDYMPRFAEDGGVLTIDVVKEPMGLLEEVYADTAHVISGSRYACKVEVDCLTATGQRRTKVVSLSADENGGWLIDSAVY